MEEAPRFTYTGVDFAGPLYVKGDNGCISKAWVCPFTCCVTKAVHLDLVPYLTTEAFIHNLRFTAHKGFPVRMISDNGMAFKATAKAILAMLRHAEVKHYLSGD